VGWGGRKSAVLGLEFLHEAGEGVNGVHADGVVDAGAAAADGAVAFEANHVQGGGFLDELGFEFFAGEAPGDVHDGAEFVDGAATVVAAGIFAGITSYSEPEPNYATVVVSRGDTLWTIARKVKPGIDPRKTIYQIKQMNELESVNLKPGQTLIIPM